MPRIPKGNFDTAPSMDIASAKVGQVDTVGTKLLRQTGTKALQIANAWETVQTKAEALEGVSKAEEEVNTFGDSFDNLVKDSVRGKLSDGSKLTDVVKTKMDSMRTAHLSKMKDNPQQAELYNQMVLSKMQGYMNKAESTEKLQIAKGVDDDLNKKLEAIKLKNIMGEDFTQDKLEFNMMANEAVGVLSRDGISAKAGLLDKTIGLTAHKELEYKGWSADREKKVRAKIASSNLDETEQLAAKMQLEQAITTGQAVTKRKSDKEYNEFLNQVRSPDKYMASRDKAKTVLKDYMTLPIQPYETQEERDGKVSQLVSTMVSNQVFLNHGGVLTGKTPEDAKAKQEQLRTDASRIKTELMGDGRLPAGDSLDDVIMAKITAMQVKTNSRGGALSTYQTVDPMFTADINSGDPDRLEAGMARLSKFYDDNQVEAHNRTIVSLDEAEQYGKLYAGTKGLGKGDADPTGFNQLGIIRNVQKKYGEDRAGKALDDIVTFGGGSKSGATNVPATWAVASYIGDDNFAAQVLSAHNRMDENFKTMPDPKGARQAIDREIRDNTDITKLRHGVLSDNDTFATGYAESIKALAMAEMVNGTKADDAVEMAEKKLKKHLAISSSNKGTVMLPAKVLEKNGFTTDDLNDAVESVSNFDLMEQQGINIAWDKMNPAVSGKGSSLAPILNKIAKQKNPTEQAAMAQKYLGDRLMIVNDGRNTNNATLYLKTHDSAPVPLILDAGNDASGNKQYRRSNFNMLDVMNNSRRLDNKYRVETKSTSVKRGEDFTPIGDDLAPIGQ